MSMAWFSDGGRPSRREIFSALALRREEDEEEEERADCSCWKIGAGMRCQWTWVTKQIG
jgi:hypothetical protein